MKDTLQFIITSIVQHPEAVSITEEEIDGVITFTISSDPTDIGKIIGKEGKIIRAIRNAMKIPAIKEGKRINISLAETAQTTAQ